MRRLVALVGLLAVACGATAAHAQTIALAFHAGDVYKYALHVVVKTQLTGMISTPIALDASSKETVTVTSVDASGDAEVTITTSDVTLKSTMGTVTTTTSGLPGQTVTMTISPDGRVLKVDGQPLAGMGFSVAGGAPGSFISAVLPPEAVKPGDTWSKTYDVPNKAGAGSIHIVANSKYLRDETVQNTSTAVVETNGTVTVSLSIDLANMFGPAGAVPGNVTGEGSPAVTASPVSITITGGGTSDTTTWIDAAGHRLVKTHQSGTATLHLSYQAAAAPNATISAPKSAPTDISATESLDLTPA